MTGFAIVWTGQGRFDAAVDEWVHEMTVGAREGVMATAWAMVRQAKANATNPPPRLASLGTQGRDPGTGPAPVSRALRTSIRIKGRGPVPFGYVANVISDMPYSARIEYGFFGTDSLGRHYSQPAYPYLRPAYAFVVSVVAERAFQTAWAARSPRA